MKIVIAGLSITSSWGNGHATTYRGLVRELAGRGHDVLFLERDVPWYRDHRDLPEPPYGETALYDDLRALRARHAARVRNADLVILGSCVPDGVDVGHWIADTTDGLFAFYDIDTPVTVTRLGEGTCDYVSPEVIRRLDLYLSFAGGELLDYIAREYGAPVVRQLACSADPGVYHPEPDLEPLWDLGYMGTYSEDRQEPLRTLMLEAAREWPEGRFVVAGPQYPDSVDWPANVERIHHLPPADHRSFYNRQRFTLNVTRADMVRAGHSPSVRLFEAGACATPIITDPWQGLDAFFLPGRELLVAESAEDTLRYLREIAEDDRREIGRRGREAVLSGHTAAHRARELEAVVSELSGAAGGAEDGRPRRAGTAGSNDGRPPARAAESNGRGVDPEVRRRVEALGPWFHNLHLPDGTQTAPEHELGDFPAHKWRRLVTRLPEDLEGWSVLDIGCNAGFYSFELARRGARVLGIDHDERYLEQARWARDLYGLSDRVRLEKRDVYDLAGEPRTYDMVLFMGVFYHLRYPLLGLDIASRMADRLFLFQSLSLPGEAVYENEADRNLEKRDRLTRRSWPRMAFIEHSFADDPTNWWFPNLAAVEAMLRSTGLHITARAGDMYVCEPRSAEPSRLRPESRLAEAALAVD